MSTAYPYGIDSFINPSASNHLNDAGVSHSAQHRNLNDAMSAVQNWIGVSSSFPLTGGVSSSIEYRLHNIENGHDHDGINSKPVVLGPPIISGSVVDGVISYVSGLFPFSSSTPVGNSIDQINRYLLTVSSSLQQSGSSVSSSLDQRQLVLLAESPGGPYEGFTTGTYKECGYINNIFLTQSVWYEDITKTKKISETYITYNSNKTISTITQSVFASDGSTALKTSIDQIFYSGIRETHRIRNIY